MNEGNIQYFYEDTSFSLQNTLMISEWILNVIHSENYSLLNLNFIFCSDEYLLQINTNFLNHDYYTDVITFDNSDLSDLIEGDIFISIERVSENALKLGISFSNELNRVMVHGLLHLLGYSDKTSNEQIQMRQIEDKYLSLRNF